MNDQKGETDTSNVSRRTFLGASTAVLAGAIAPALASADPNGRAAKEEDAAASAAPGRLVQTVNGLEIEISEKTGGLTRLTYHGVGSVLLADEEFAGLLTIGCPVKSFPALLLEPRLSKADVARTEGGGISIVWDQLNANRSVKDMPAGRVRASVHLNPASDGRSIVLRARVENHLQGEIAQILFPDLNGLRPIDDPELMELRMALGTMNPLAGPVDGEGRTPFYAPILWQQYPARGLYERNALRWMDYGSLKGGFSLFEKAWLTEPRPDILTHRNEADPDELRLVWQQNVQLRPGEVWESAEYWLTPHSGGWAKGIEPFRNYVRAANPPRKIAVPERVRNGLGFQTIWMIQSAECDPKYAAFRFADLGRVARDAKAHGIDELVLWGWCHYGTFPITVREELGTAEELLAGIREAREMGVNVAPFVSIKQVDDRFAKPYGVPPGSSAAWIFHPEMIPAMYPFDAPSGRIDVVTTNMAWQGDVYTALSEWVKRGVTSFDWDVFDDAGSMRLIELIRRVREEVNPELAGSFAAEVVNGSVERATQVLDYTWNWNDYLDAGPYTAALKYPRLNTNVQSSARVVKMAFADNLYINAMPKKPNQPNGTKLIGEEPELSAALQEVAPLRARFLRYFTDGDYLGDSFLARPAAPFIRRQASNMVIDGACDGFEYPPAFIRGYRLGRQLLIIVLNNESEARKVTLESDLTAWLPDGKTYRVNSYNGRGERTQSNLWRAGSNWVGTTGNLGPLDLAFFELSAA